MDFVEQPRQALDLVDDDRGWHSWQCEGFETVRVREQLRVYAKIQEIHVAGVRKGAAKQRGLSRSAGPEEEKALVGRQTKRPGEHVAIIS